MTCSWTQVPFYAYYNFCNIESCVNFFYLVTKKFSNESSEIIFNYDRELFTWRELFTNKGGLHRWRMRLPIERSLV